MKGRVHIKVTVSSWRGQSYKHDAHYWVGDAIDLICFPDQPGTSTETRGLYCIRRWDSEHLSRVGWGEPQAWRKIRGLPA